MPGPPRKPDAIRRQSGTWADPQPPDARLVNPDPPPYPADLDPTFAEAWRDYWDSDLAGATHASTDLQALRRLFHLYSESEKLRRVTKEHPFLEGSQGQTVLNPAYRLLSSFDAECRQLEDRFGMNPRSRMALGLALGAGARSSLADLIVVPPLLDSHVLD